MSNRLVFKRNLRSDAVPQQRYRRSRVHPSLQMDQEATGMEKCDEEILVGYGHDYWKVRKEIIAEQKAKKKNKK